MNDRELLKDLILKLSVTYGDYTLTNGDKTTYYVDLRLATLSHKSAPIIGKLLWEKLKDLGPIDAIGGLTMGADPVATAIMHYAHYQGENVDAFVIRKAAKTHGIAGKLIEGPDIAGKNVVIVEDTCSSGGSAIKAANAAKEHGANILAIAVIADRESGATEAIEAAGYKYIKLFTLSELEIN